MIVFQIHLRAAIGAQDQLEHLLTNEFIPAVRRQPGFLGVEVLRSYAEQPSNPPALLGDGYRHQIVLTFLDEAHRQAWAASDDHQAVFPRVRALVEDARAVGYEILDRHAAKAAE